MGGSTCSPRFRTPAPARSKFKRNPDGSYKDRVKNIRFQRGSIQLLFGNVGCDVLLYFLDLSAVAVFAVSGVLAARDRDLDLLGVIVVAAITAVGGGTFRDLLLDRHPIFWVTDAWYLIVIITSAILTVAYVRRWPPPGITLLVADALGLALFALSGAQYAEAAQCPPLIVVLMGTITGASGGIVRDVITAKVPLILRREIYATAAIVGIAAYQAMHAFGMPRGVAFGVGMIFVVGLRLIAIRWSLHLPVFHNQ